MTTVMTSINFDNFFVSIKTMSTNDKGQQRNSGLGNQLVELEKIFTTFAMEMIR